MDNLGQEVKRVLNESMSPQSTLTELERQQVRRKIRSSNVRIKKKVDLFPKILTGLAMSAFFILIGAFIGNQYGGPIENISGSSSHKTEAIDHKSVYENMSDGEVLNGWTLKNDYATDGAKTTQSGLRTAYFVGRTTVEGKVIFYDEKDIKNPSRMVFYPSQKSLKALPIEEGTSEEIVFSFEQQQQLESILGMMPGTEKEVKMLVNQYTAYYKSGSDIPDVISFLKIMQPGEKESITTDHLFTINDDLQFVLPSHLQNIYETLLVKTKNNSLKDLTPYEVFQLYWYAEEQKDYDKQYALFIDDPDQIPVFASLEDYLEAANKSINQYYQKDMMERIKHRTKDNPLREELIDETHANIIINEEEGIGFGLVKNQEGIWKVKWLPLQ
ncbi:hypothetical protein [Neobacillus sp. D3-1R]|uniref:hypothetical protein n=1 Tax=Neobacillus sp. D3-1R TaxID=3445778 RepID=UPI003F9EE940